MNRWKVIDHDMDSLFELVEKVTVLQEGRVLVEGAPRAIRTNPKVQEAYLGGVHGVAARFLLEVNGLNSYYGQGHILFDVSLHVEMHATVALLGRNDAGKSTTLKSLMGAVSPPVGSIKLGGVELAGQKAHSIARLGTQLVHEDRRIFGSLTVEENIILAGLTAENKWQLDRIYKMFPRLKERRASRGTDLSGASSRMLAVARARARSEEHLA
jgi:ABC-type branched-subunit amino acid transport system ATPase component